MLLENEFISSFSIFSLAHIASKVSYCPLTRQTLLYSPSITTSSTGSCVTLVGLPDPFLFPPQLFLYFLQIIVLFNIFNTDLDNIDIDLDKDIDIDIYVFSS